MIVLFTSNHEGGVLQLTFEIYKNLKEIGEDVFCFVPEKAKQKLDTYTKDVPNEGIVYYEYVKKIYKYSKKIKSICTLIKKYNPEYIWFMDSAILSSQVCINLKYNKCIYSIHDYASDHPTNSMSLLKKMKNIYNKRLFQFSLKKSHYILSFSNEGVEYLKNKYVGLSNKILTINLGPHILTNDIECPKELSDISNYILFFGRIDKYKGINRLLEAHLLKPSSDKTLVIAGSGQLTDEEKKMLEKNSNVIFINRYIEDFEINHLFKNCAVVVLPYLEASQSGVIPLAYKFGKPVIVSNIKGLTQVVEDYVTGYIFNDIYELNASMSKSPDEYELMKINIEKYFLENMDWNNNLKKFLDNVRRDN